MPIMRLITASVWLMVMQAACAPSLLTSAPRTLQVYADGATANLANDVVDEPALYDLSARRVNLAGAINEVLSFRMEVRADGVIGARVGDFVSATGQLLNGNTSLYQVHHVRVDQWPGWHLRRHLPSERERFVPDVLVPADAPRGGLPVNATADRPVKLWVEVRIPRGTSPGVYSAPLTVTIAGATAQELDISLTVWPFELPDDAGVEFLADLDHRGLFAHHVSCAGQPCSPERVLADHPAARELQAVLSRGMGMLREHGLTPQLPRLYPVVQIKADGHAEVDWSDYDRAVSGFLDGSAFADGRPLRFWQLPIDERFPDELPDPAAPSPMYARLLSDFAGSAAAHCAQMGWLNRAYVRIPFTDVMGSRAQTVTHHFGYILRRAASQLPVVSTLFPQDMAGYGWYGFRFDDLRDDVSIWSPRAQFFDRAAIAQDLGARTWFTVDRPPFSGTTAVSGTESDARSIGWQAYRARAEAVRLGWVNSWPVPSGAPTNPQECVGLDANVLIYPGALFGLDEPVQSVRLKRLCRGKQDLAYLSLLTQRGKEHIAVTLGETLVPALGAETYGLHFADGGKPGWIANSAAWDMARRIMADELMGGLARGPASAGTLPNTIRWRRLMDLTRRVQVQVIGVRVQPAGAHVDQGVEVACTLSLTNSSRLPVEGKVSFTTLPVGWTSVPGIRYVPQIDPGSTRQVTLSAITGSLTWNTDGALELPIRFEPSEGEPNVVMARLTHVTAAPLSQAVMLDGDPGEWPTGIGNDAAGFLLATQPDPLKPAAALPKPRHATLALVGQRDGKLYFAVRCALSPGRQPPLMRRPADIPDDLVPTGAEAIEILLDPANAGSPSTTDVYRIVVGPGGAFWQQGVSTRPPTCPERPWSAAIRHAIRVAGDHWSAEIEVPLDAFPESLRRGRTWGLNITRFDLEYQEYSNWAGAAGCVYNPRSLGNLTLP